MEIYIEKEDPYFKFKKVLSVLMITGYMTGVLAFNTETSSEPVSVLETASIQANSFLSISNSQDPIRIKKVKVVVTAYSSTVCQTDNTPFITASGSYVEEGIVANNMLPFGTEIMIPELYGDKIFVVEDRMNQKKGYYHVDIWFPEYDQAKDFGAKITYIEIIES
jgi:3D (Asp-Asp-Asp) domain-containing protein